MPGDPWQDIFLNELAINKFNQTQTVMKRTIFLTGLMTLVIFGTMAQVTPQGAPGVAVPQGRDSRALTFPYASQGTYNPVEANQVPQNIQSSFGTDYTGVTGARWEYNNDVYRSSFMQDGKNRSVLYGQDGRVIETRTGTTVNDLPSSVRNALEGKNATSPYEIKVGQNTYYSTQVDGKEVYYDSNGSAVNIPQQPK
ncbi:MAG: hypothetical protein ABS46_20115 [Cytophagaceae bacterium SCN 52-12]|nr:MAG: hypothetical protein ABS46_20115 [Cytophagaceae bacterium SCN 52-12]